MAKVLLVGRGAREHALAHALSAHEVLVAPGNTGTSDVARNVAVDAEDVAGLVALARAERVDLAVIGPEAPLVLGVTDALEAAGVRVFGPNRAAARLEGSKAFMKEVAREAGAPTADFVVARSMADVERALAERGPLVVKADGLCAGKGVVVAGDVAEARDAAARMLGGAFGEAGRTLVLEERLPGEEASLHVLTDGVRVVALPVAQDHKRLEDGDRGPNTGGMGAYAPAPVCTDAVRERALEHIVRPVLARLAERGAPFRGVLFVGLMIDAGEPRLLEFNVRFGDPEATCLLPLLADDAYPWLDGVARGALDPRDVRVRGEACLSVVLAASGYPAAPRRGDVVEGLDAAARVPGVTVFHAGTERGDDGRVVTAGGRVLVLSARAETLADARARAYEAEGFVQFADKVRRSDIGARALSRG